MISDPEIKEMKKKNNAGEFIVAYDTGEQEVYIFEDITFGKHKIKNYSIETTKIGHRQTLLYALEKHIQNITIIDINMEQDIIDFPQKVREELIQRI